MPRFASNISAMFGEVEFLDRFAAAAGAGFRAIEFHTPYGYPKDRLVDRLAEHDLEVVLFNLPMGDGEAGEVGIACLPERRGEFRDGLERAVDYARALGCRQLNCIAGIAPRDRPRAKLLDTLVENLSFAADALRKAGIRLMIEPLNERDVPGFLLSRSGEAVEVIESLGAADVFLQYDFYHAQVMQEDLASTLERLLPRIGHVQFSDNPGRHEPGTGEIDFPFLFDRLDSLGYRGWVGAEYWPSGSTAASLAWFEPYRRNRRHDAG
jgi:hydroxypyruvate isomerase